VSRAHNGASVNLDDLRRPFDIGYRHRPGHNVLFLKLAKTGPIVLSGDLYRYPEERTLKRLPVAD